MVLSLVGVVMILLSLWKHDASYFWIEAWFVIEILVLTVLTRSMGAYRGLLMLAQGVFIGGGLTLLVGQGLKLVGVDIDAGFWSSYVFPVVEELAKIAPVVLFAYLFYRKEKVWPNISDFLFLAVMAGAGFSMFEKYFWEGIYFPFTYGPHIGDLYFFSDALGINVAGEPFGFIGHSAATGLIGLGIGFGLYCKKKFKACADWWWLTPVVAFSWVTLEHVLSNLYYSNGSEALLAIGGGMLTPWIFLAVMIGALCVDFKASWKFLGEFPRFKKELASDWKGIIKGCKKGHFAFKKAWVLCKKVRFVNLIGWNR